MTAGDSKAALTITLQPALAPSPQPRPAPTARALPPGLVAQVGQNWTPIMGQNWMPIDTGHQEAHRIAVAGHQALAILIDRDQGVVIGLLHGNAAIEELRIGAL